MENLLSCLEHQEALGEVKALLNKPWIPGEIHTANCWDKAPKSPLGVHIIGSPSAGKTTFATLLTDIGYPRVLYLRAQVQDARLAAYNMELYTRLRESHSERVFRTIALKLRAHTVFNFVRSRNHLPGYLPETKSYPSKEVTSKIDPIINVIDRLFETPKLAKEFLEKFRAPLRLNCHPPTDFLPMAKGKSVQEMRKLLAEDLASRISALLVGLDIDIRSLTDQCKFPIVH